MHPHMNLVDVLRAHADTRPNTIAYTFLEDGETPGRQLSFAQLDEQARIVGATLQQLTAPGDRALLLYPPGLDFVIAFLGCQYAGVIAVPALPPNMNSVQSTITRVANVVANADPAIVLTTAKLLPQLRAATQTQPGFERLLWQASDHLNANRARLWRPPSLQPEDLSFLQYTSGSTSAPKGVMVSHANILYNLQMLRETTAMPDGCNIVSWLPLFHDLGLIGIVLNGLHLGAHTQLMSPMSFLKRPVRWLRAIAGQRQVISGGPNFAFDSCIRRVSEADKQGLDLSGWSVAFCGAETVRAGTMERFYAAFAGCGLRKDALLPCYGLAEATLVVSGRTPGRPYQSRELDKATLERGEARPARAHDPTVTVVSCGTPKLAQELAIVDPESLRVCADAEIGEVWVKGDNIARGYWRDPERSEATFAAMTAAGDGPYLRTGDLGFVVDGELYVTGRIKEIIIIRGRCLYPQDLELMVESMAGEFPEIAAEESVAVALHGADRERVGLVMKINRRKNPAHDPELLIAAIQAQALERFELGFGEIVLVRSGVPKTSSGKKMRSKCQQMLERGLEAELNVEHHFRQAGLAARIDVVDVVDPGAKRQTRALTQSELGTLVLNWIAKEEQLDPAQMSTSQQLTDFALDSLATVSLVEFLEQRLATSLSGTALTQFRTIDELTHHLVPSRDND